jgi:SAM-dependent methyltransferase
MSLASKPWIARVRELLTGTEAVLDVGCSTGHVMAGIRDSARKVFGHELSRKEVAFCRDELQLDVADTPLHERFEPATFDYILLIFVLEHIGRPVEFLSYLKQFLKPDGKFVILVPNVSDPLLQFYRIPAFDRFYFCIEHLFYYSPKTIGDLFAQAGLSGLTETVQEYPITNHLNWGYHGRPSETLASRKAIPDIEIADEGKRAAWERFWIEVDSASRSFMTREGYGDRLWSVVERCG